MPTRTYKAHVFTSQGSQTIRLPNALRLPGKIVQIQKTKAGLIVTDSKPHAERLREFAKLFDSCPNFPEIERTDFRKKLSTQTKTHGSSTGTSRPSAPACEWIVTTTRPHLYRKRVAFLYSAFTYIAHKPCFSLVKTCDKRTAGATFRS